ncbi:hypothetical protein POM88_012975 [Heracleum sosnowskyi]|uniref:Uncharacterized protein n=1 Tax=Heracleum sosnowskyi TaxID=360622 RepID=A0AAD8N291_9APIA|nr:hypothetical protein POM88_012975 [Heracleum sosnowskyi]
MAESSNTNVIGVDEKDHITDLITELPRHLQETILNCLPILGMQWELQWRYSWTKILDLILLGQFRSYMNKKFSVYNDDPLIKAEEFVKVLHESSPTPQCGPIVHFNLGFPPNITLMIR